MIIINNIQLYQGDCLEVMKNIPDGSIDCIICDLPYGTTKCDCDTILPFDKMWKEINRVIKNKGAICLFGNEPFSSYLRLSNIKCWKYDWIWHKSKCGSAFTSKYRPQQKHEIISVFSKNGGKITYCPKMKKGEPYYRHRKANKGNKPNNHKLGVISDSETYNTGERYPETVIFFQQKWRRQDQIHPMQKPVELLEYLITTYTKQNETVLDFTMGSGSCGVAATNLDRNFVGIELNEKYFEIAKERIHSAQQAKYV